MLYLRVSIRVVTKNCRHHLRLLKNLKGGLMGGAALEKMQGHAAFLKAAEVGQGLKDARAVRRKKR